MKKIFKSKTISKKPVIKNEVRLAKSVIHSWQETVIHFCKFSKGTEVQKETPEKLVQAAINFEKKNLKEIWVNFTQSRKNINSNMLTTRDKSNAYLLGFHLGNVARIQYLISRAEKFTPFVNTINEYQSIDVFDLGCGSGAMSVGVLQFLKQNLKRQIPLNIKLADNSSYLLSIAEYTLNAFKMPNLTVRKFKGPLDDLNISKNTPESQSLGLYTLGYIWNELSHDKNGKNKIVNLIECIVEKKHEALIFIVEPANEFQSKNAMHLRNDLIDLGFQVLYPCSHQKQCPLLETDKDWCYSEMGWKKPEIQSKIDKIMGVERDVMALSGYVFASPAFVKKHKWKLSQNEEVIVGRPITSNKGGSKAQYILCGKEGIRKEQVENSGSLLPKGYRFKTTES